MKDDLVERTLAALGKVEAPEGLESRVLRGLERNAASIPTSGRVRLDMGHSVLWFGAAWWRGAVTGAAFAVVLMGVGMVVQHKRQELTDHGGLVVTIADRIGPAPKGDRGGAGLATCAGAARGTGEMRARSGGGAPRLQEIAVESSERWHPVPSPGLTFQERELVRLASKGKPEELAMLNPEVREKMAAQEAEEFQQFFTQPVRKVLVDLPAEPDAAGQSATEPKSDVAPAASKQTGTAQ